MSKDSFNPFHLFGLRPSFKIDLKALDKSYFTCHALVHPDRFIHHSEPERQAAATQASLVNKAYEILKNPILRAKFLFTLWGMDIPGEDSKTSNHPDILEEMMDLQDTLIEAQSPQDFQQVGTLIQEALHKTEDSFLTAESEGHKQKLPAIFVRLVYLSRLGEEAQTRQRQSSINIL